MSAIFKFLFERATDPLGLPINAFYEYIILAVIGAVAYGIAYSKVGDMYHSSLISGRTEGSFFHWLIRLILFVGLWLLAYGAIQGYYFVTANWQIILMIAGSVAGAAMLCTLAVTAMRFFKKHRTVNGNA
jgi:putative membrane protein